MSGQIQKALSAMDTIEKYEVRRTPINRLIVSTFTAKTDMYQSIGLPEKVPDLLADIGKYSPEYISQYDCLAAASAIQRGFDSQMDKEKLAGCSEHYKSYGKGYNKYWDLIVAYQSQDYESCSKILNEDDGRIKGMFFEKYFLVNVYKKIGNIEKAKEILQAVIDQKDDDAIYYYQMALIMENEDQNAAKGYLQTALQFWSNADENFIPLQKANELAKRLNVL